MLLGSSPDVASCCGLHMRGLHTSACIQPVKLTQRPHLPLAVHPSLLLSLRSLWSLIKDMVGKDLTRVCLPVYFNEPLSALQVGARVCFGGEPAAAAAGAAGEVGAACCCECGEVALKVESRRLACRRTSGIGELLSICCRVVSILMICFTFCETEIGGGPGVQQVGGSLTACDF